MATSEERSHQLGDEYRARSNADERQFVNWIAVASGAGIGLVVHFIVDDHKHPLALSAVATIPALIAWLVGIMSAGISLYGMFREQAHAGNMFHAIGRRERQKAKLKANDGSNVEIATIVSRAADFHEEADRQHRLSRRWLARREIAMASAVVLFAFGVIWAAGELVAALISSG